MKIIILISLLLVSFTSIAQSQVVKVLGSKTRFTVRKIDGLKTGKKVFVSDKNDIYKTLEAGILECKVQACLAEVTSNSEGAQISEGSLVVQREKKQSWSAELGLTNALGLVPSAGIYYTIPKSPWNIGIKYKMVSTTISDIKLSGSLISLEAQRYIWHKSHFQVWGAAELGMALVKMDLSKFSSQNTNVNKSASFIALGIDGRYILTSKLQVVAGLGFMNDTLSQKFEGNSGTYTLETKALNITQKVALIYFF